MLDMGERHLLNLGHTIGHAVEVASSHSISHGAAVSIGMVREMEIAERLGICKSGEAEKVRRVLQKLGLPVETELELDLSLDKKRVGGKIEIVMVEEIGKVGIKKIGLEELK